MLTLSPRIYKIEDSKERFVSLLSYTRTLTYNGEKSVERVFYTIDETDGSYTFHIIFGNSNASNRWTDTSVEEDEQRFYDCDKETFKHYIGACAYYGEIGVKDWRMMDDFLERIQPTKKG